MLTTNFECPVERVQDSSPVNWFRPEYSIIFLEASRRRALGFNEINATNVLPSQKHKISHKPAAKIAWAGLALISICDIHVVQLPVVVREYDRNCYVPCWLSSRNLVVEVCMRKVISLTGITA